MTTSVSDPLVGDWALDPAHSYLSFTTRFMRIGSFAGRFTRFEGTLVLGPSGDHHAHGTIATDSIETGLPARDDVLRGADYLDAQAHPEIGFDAPHFALAPDGSVQAEGTLTIRGVSQTVSLSGALAGPMEMMGIRIGLDLCGTLSREAFGVAGGADLPDGPAIDDAIAFRLGMHALRAEEG